MIIHAKSVTVITGNGPDTVIIHTDLTAPVSPYQECLNLTFYVGKGQGGGYAVSHFPSVPLKVVNLKE